MQFDHHKKFSFKLSNFQHAIVIKFYKLKLPCSRKMGGILNLLCQYRWHLDQKEEERAYEKMILENQGEHWLVLV